MMPGGIGSPRALPDVVASGRKSVAMMPGGISPRSIAVVARTPACGPASRRKPSADRSVRPPDLGEFGLGRSWWRTHWPQRALSVYQWLCRAKAEIGSSHLLLAGAKPRDDIRRPERPTRHREVRAPPGCRGMPVRGSDQAWLLLLRPQPVERLLGLGIVVQPHGGLQFRPAVGNVLRGD